MTQLSSKELQKIQTKTFWGKVVNATKHPELVWSYCSKVVFSPRFWYEFIFTYYDSRMLRLKKDAKILFVDGGSNIGQGFRWFSKHYTGKNIDFHLFEPNPNCLPYLEEVKKNSAEKVQLFPFGLGTENTKTKFYGLDDAEGGPLSQGGSIVKDHLSSMYTASDDVAIAIEIIDFSEYLTEQSNKYDFIVVKMDIEGAEVPLLEHIIEKGTHTCMYILYIEFHAWMQTEEHKIETEKREKEIIKKLENSKVKYRIWH